MARKDISTIQKSLLNKTRDILLKNKYLHKNTEVTGPHNMSLNYKYFNEILTTNRTYEDNEIPNK